MTIRLLPPVPTPVLVAAGMPVAALNPLELARRVLEKGRS